MNIIEELCLWFNKERSSLIAIGLHSALEYGSLDYDPRAVWLDLDSAHRVGRLTLWETGAAELSVGDVKTGEIVVEEHREITSTVGLEDAVESLIAWVRWESIAAHPVSGGSDLTEERLWMLAKNLDGHVENDILRVFRKEVSYGEYGLGLENLCEQLSESNARLPKAILDEIVEVAILMRLPAERWNFVMALEEWAEDSK